MINAAKDPKGYYVALGIAEDASTDDIKSAFRSKAKRLHPDHNPSPIAAKQFHRLHEAYETLSDPTRRATYDRGWRTFTGGASTEQQPPPKQDPPKSDPPRQEPPKKEPPRTEPPKPERPKTAEHTHVNLADQPATCQCGKITAQPRYIIFDMVWGRVRRTVRKGLAGVYCRTCADKAAIKASLITWLAGWWAWPTGPRDTIRALANNIRGGRKPPERNGKLLIRQAKAFKARGDMELARACAEQALSFTTNANLRREVDALLMSLSSFPARGIKDRWANPGVAPFIQLAPIIAIVGGLSMAATLSAPVSLTEYVKALVNGEESARPAAETAAFNADIRTGRIYAVNVASMAVRTGPGDGYRIDARIPQGTIVLVTEQDAGGRWVRILLTTGATGFVDGSGLTPNVDIDVLNKLGAFADTTAPATSAPVD